MTSILFVGEDPDTVDYSDPALPPGLDAAKIKAGIEQALRDMRARGWRAEFCSVRPDGSAADTLRERLESANYDCVVVGGGIRVPPKSLLLFEALLNTIHRHAPDAAIAFNTKPEDSAEAAARWIDASGNRQAGPATGQ